MTDPGVSDGVYDGPATVQIDGANHDVHVRLTGRLDPVDGRYHWQGTILDDLPGVKLGQSAVVAIDDRTAEARITERTPWGRYAVVGIGSPPYALDMIG